MSDPVLSARTPGASTWWEPYRDAVEKLNALTTKLAAAEAKNERLRQHLSDALICAMYDLKEMDWAAVEATLRDVAPKETEE